MLGPRIAERALNTGKPYAKALRGHKMTWQAMWGLLLPQLNTFISERSLELHGHLDEALASDNFDQLLDRHPADQ